MDEFHESCSEAECVAEFEGLFPNGFSGPDVRAEIAFERIIDLSGRDAWEIERDIGELVGRCVWDVFSDQHDVIGEDGRGLHLGSFRYAGEFLADFENRRTQRRCHDYMSFYLGTTAPWACEGIDLTPVYELIFRRLKSRKLDWVYRFPRVHLMDFRPLREAMDREGKPDWADYSPSEALAKEEESQKRAEEIAEFRERLEEARDEAIEEALTEPPPPRVQAYRNVYAHWPEGWPPTARD